jgi:hypothetical protein
MTNQSLKAKLERQIFRGVLTSWIIILMKIYLVVDDYIRPDTISVHNHFNAIFDAIFIFSLSIWAYKKKSIYPLILILIDFAPILLPRQGYNLFADLMDPNRIFVFYIFLLISFYLFLLYLLFISVVAAYKLRSFK